MKDVYDWEIVAFYTLAQQEKNAIVRYFGHYSHREVVNTESSTTYNLLLEFGQEDLDEYFAGPSSPPVRAEEIIRFWESLFKVADAIKSVHNVIIKISEKRKVNYNG